jgi:hypothetical protein
MKKQFLTLKQFAILLASIKLSSFAQAQSVTEPKLNKKSRTTGEPLPFATVLNCRNINIQLNYNYENQVVGRDLKSGGDGTFEAQEHAWAKHFEGALALHKSAVADMLNLDLTKCYMPYVKVRVDSQKYIADGKEISKDVLVPFMPPKDDYSSQPQDNKVRVEYMKLSSIKTFVYAGTEYQIVG